MHMTQNTTVVLRLTGPMMAWGAGTGASWETRPSLRRPTKSAVIGMVANMMGRDRADDISDLIALRFAVRGDRPGYLLEDQQTAGGGTFPPSPAQLARDPELAARPDLWAYGAPRGPRKPPDGRLTASWSRASRTTVMLVKTYLVDAAFLCGLTGNPATVEAVINALQRPQRLPYLGRRNCPLSNPPLHLITNQPNWYTAVPLLPEATTTTPEVWYETAPGEDTEPNREPNSELNGEQPLNFATRDYTSIALATARVTPPEAQTRQEESAEIPA